MIAAIVAAIGCSDARAIVFSACKQLYANCIQYYNHIDRIVAHIHNIRDYNNKRHYGSQ